MIKQGTTQSGVAVSHHRDARTAGREAAERALAAAGIDRPDFLFAFSSVGYDQEAVVGSIREATGRAPLAGCSGEGIIAQGEADETPFSVGVMVIRSDEMRFRHGLVRGLKDSRRAGRATAEALRGAVGADARALYVYADALTFNFDGFTGALEEELGLGRHLPILGGTAGDNWEMKRTYQYCDDQIVSDGLSWVLLSGDVRVVSAVKHGCVPIGVERKVTRAEGNVIYEIDGKPVLEVLKEYLVGDEVDEWQKTIVNLCLGFKAPAEMEDYDQYLIRFMPAKDDANGSIMISTEVATGSSIWMTRRDQEKIAESVVRIGERIRDGAAGERPKLVLHFDCAGRGKFVLRDQQKLQLLESLQETVGRDTPWLGFYCYGEMGPVGARNYFHNYTAVVAAVY